MTNQSQPAELAGQRVVITWPVQWGDQDAFGHVNNVVYFRWMESARIEYFGRAGVQSAAAQQGAVPQGVGPILASIKCDFRRQLIYPDTVLISASVASFGRTSMKMVHRVYSTAQQAIAAEGDSTIVMFDYDAQRPVVVSEEIRGRIEALEGRKFGPKAE
jgi:acyl-CoA thioester hydrolase